MYRYPIKKTASDNKKFKSKKINATGSSSKTTAKKGTRVTSTKASVKPKRTTNTKKPSTTKNKSKKQVHNSVLLKLRNFLWNSIKTILIVGGIVLIIIFVVVSAFNFFLPSVFRLEETKNLLFLTNETANEQKVFFVHLSPESQIINVVNIDPNLPVNVLGGYGQYPLRSLAPLLTLDNKDTQSILATYNFALNEVIDEVYFLGELPDLTKKNNLEKTLFSLTTKHWQQYHQWPDTLTKAYFFVKDQVASNFSTTSVDQDNLAVFHNQLYSKNSLNDCPMVVINTTSQSGLAAKVASVLEKNGFLITRLTSQSPEVEKTQIYYDETIVACQELVNKASKIFPVPPEIITDKEKMANYRASSAILIGSDMLD